MVDSNAQVGDATTNGVIEVFVVKGVNVSEELS